MRGDGTTCCGRSCVDPQSDPGNCGNLCTAGAHATVVCLSSTCAVTGCDAGWADCDGNAADGCEVNTSTDAKNCGTCGHACIGATPYCDQGTCTAAPTPAAPQIALGGNHTCVLLVDGTVACWGGNDYGQLGLGSSDSSSHSKPVQVPGLTNVVELTAGSYHTCARLGDGSTYCWGRNDSGQLGDGTTTNRSAPTQVSRLVGAVELASSSNGNHVCARLSDGTVYCWGSNEYGRLGDGTTTNRSVPTKVSGITTAIQLALGGSYSCALLVDGSMSCWGNNFYGQLGDGTTTIRSVPTRVSGLSGVAEIGVGSSHTCARLAAGTIYCWGYNGYGQLANGTIDSSTHATPVQIAGVSGATRLVTGSYQIFAVLQGGSVYGWGRNDYGQLGIGSTTNRTTAVSVPALSGATQITGGYYHTCAVLTDGSLSCWGYNNYGQLGNGTITNRSVPTPVVW